MAMGAAHTVDVTDIEPQPIAILTQSGSRPAWRPSDSRLAMREKGGLVSSVSGPPPSLLNFQCC